MQAGVDGGKQAALVFESAAARGAGLQMSEQLWIRFNACLSPRAFSGLAVTASWAVSIALTRSVPAPEVGTGSSQT